MNSLDQSNFEMMKVEEDIELAALALEAAAKKLRSGEDWDMDPKSAWSVYKVSVNVSGRMIQKNVPCVGLIWSLLQRRKEANNQLNTIINS
ncbi:MAG: hypothetical protein F4103_03735 [Boseongicola sp. SB0673_bin_14]|nr:hypothetical protein [Boseongicola sp. SB0673_bin_14]